MNLNEVILGIAGLAVVGSLLIVFITALSRLEKEDPTPQYKRTPEDQVAEYEILNDPAFHI